MDEQIITDESNDNPNILLFSSLFFITNAAAAFYYEYYLYSTLFVILTITSLIVHYNDNMYINIIDKLAVLSIVFYGAYLFYTKINVDKLSMCIVIFSTFLLCIYFYIYGFITKKYCFYDEKCIAQKYHFIMHRIASVGHHFIIFL